MSNQDKQIIIRTAEIFLKKKNRNFFENILVANIKDAIGSTAKLRVLRHRIAVFGYLKSDESDIIKRLLDVPGIHSVSPVYECTTDITAITELCASLYNGFKTFRMTVNRADKTFMGSSLNICIAVADELLARFPTLSVDLHNPEANINIDVRENKQTFVYFETFFGLGGMPVGSAGRGLALLSGGLDSPVSSYLMSKRGMKVKFLHFHSFPYTGEGAKDKVINLAKQVSRFNGRSQIIIVSVTNIQESIRDNCHESYAITLLRRFMMRIAQIIANENKCMALITGESLGQVASQTIESLNATNAVVNIPVFRPLIAYDKEDIIAIAKKIGTFDISIQPYEDCCTVFLPKNPQTRPILLRVEGEESKLDVDRLVLAALKTCEVVEV